ncbi:MAG: carbohydrate kinase family protein [Bacteroidota bacterium]
MIKFDVTGLGSLAVDFIGSIESWPASGTKNGLKSFDIFDGGLTGTALSTVARLGGRAAYIGKCGSSEMAERSIKSLGNEGVDLSMVSYDPESEPIIAMVFTSTDPGDRNIFFQKENLKYPFPEEIPDRHWFKKTKVFFTDHVAGEAGVRAAKIALNAGVEVVVDIERIQDNTEALLKTASHIVVGERFAFEYSGSHNYADQVKALRKKDFQKVVITHGEKGCSLSKNASVTKVRGFKVDVIDTTGCGDVFHGAYALAVARNYPAEKALLYANAAAAMKAEYMGGRPGIPTKEKLEGFLINKKEMVPD